MSTAVGLVCPRRGILLAPGVLPFAPRPPGVGGVADAGPCRSPCRTGSPWLPPPCVAVPRSVERPAGCRPVCRPSFPLRGVA
eukprot:2807057-Prorocentrum_lima.AAC.1